MPQVKQHSKDPKPYRGSTDTDVEREAQERSVGGGRLKGRVAKSRSGRRR